MLKKFLAAFMVLAASLGFTPSSLTVFASANIDDGLSDYTKTHTNTSSAFQRDSGLYLKSAYIDGYLTYKTDVDITRFRLEVRSAGYRPDLQADITLAVSSNGSDWDNVNYTVTTGSGASPVSISYDSIRIPLGYRYLKITAKRPVGNTGDLWATKLYKVEINLTPLTADELAIPAGREIMSAIKPTHPRIITDETDFQRVQDLITAGDAHTVNWLSKATVVGDKLITEGVKNYTQLNGPNDKDLAEVRRAKENILTLGFLWRVTGNTAYAQRGRAELEKIMTQVRFWNKYHFLYVGEMCAAFAVGYDWLYDCLTPAQRTAIARDMVDLGLKAGFDYLRNGTDFAAATNNWSLVCNGGLILAALAVADEQGLTAADKEIAENVIELCLKRIKNGLDSFADDGSTSEGMPYWDFATEYLVFALSSMTASLGSTYGAGDGSGIVNTGMFPNYLIGSSGQIFNYADSWSGDRVFSPQCYWFAKAYSNPAFSYYQNKMNPSGEALSVSSGLGYDQSAALSLLWYDEAYSQTSMTEANAPIAKKYSGNGESFAFFRSSWEDGAIYAALMAGDNQSSHGDLDNGHFILDALGERWAEDMGAEDYNSYGYWNFTNKSGVGASTPWRWDYYAKRAEGHNTVVLNPTAPNEPDQNIYAKCEIERFSQTADGGYAIADISDAYNVNNIKAEVKRGLELFDNRSKVAVQDEITKYSGGANQLNTWWFMHTKASINIWQDGKTAVLTKNGKRLKATLSVVTPDVDVSKIKFESKNAARFSRGSYPLSNEAYSTSYRKLAVHIDPIITKVTIKVVLEPVLENEQLTSSYYPAPLPLEKWGNEPSAASGVLQRVTNDFSSLAAGQNGLVGIAKKDNGGNAFGIVDDTANGGFTYINEQGQTVTDTSLVELSANRGPASFVFNLACGIRSFDAQIFSDDSRVGYDVKYYISPDGLNYTECEASRRADAHNPGRGFSLYHNEAEGLPLSTRYLKVTLQRFASDTTSNYQWIPRLHSVTLNSVLPNIQVLSADFEGNTPKFELYNHDAGGGKKVFIAAAYYDENRLTDVFAEEKTLLEGLNHFELPITGQHGKLYVWDGMKPCEK